MSYSITNHQLVSVVKVLHCLVKELQVIYLNIIGKKKSTMQNNNVCHLNFILRDVWIHESKIIIIPKKHIHLWEMILFFSKSPNGWFEGDNSILFLCVLSTMLCFHILLFYCSRIVLIHTRTIPNANCKIEFKYKMHYYFSKDTENESSSIYLPNPYFTLFLSDSVNSDEYT